MTREEAIDELEWGYPKEDTSIEDCLKYKQAVDMAISALSADVRPNIHGHWEEDGHGHIICSACKEANVSTWKSRFCPMCGADMRGGDK